MLIQADHGEFQKVTTRRKTIGRQPVSRAVTLVGSVVALAAASVCFASGRPSTTPAFTKAMNTAVDHMMMAMDLNPSGNPDRDFVMTLVPHHQGAIDMAGAELRFGRNAKLKNVARKIIADQKAEIAAMRVALGQPLP